MLPGACRVRQPDPGDRTEAFRQTPLKKPQESGRENRRACSLLTPHDVARLLGRPGASSAAANNSTDLTICDWHGGGERVELVLDSAPRAQLRYYNQLAEQLEYHNQDPRRRALSAQARRRRLGLRRGGSVVDAHQVAAVAYADAASCASAREQRAVRVARLSFRRLSEPGGRPDDDS